MDISLSYIYFTLLGEAVLLNVSLNGSKLTRESAPPTQPWSELPQPQLCQMHSKFVM
jgi:hypothetical protein